MYIENHRSLLDDKRSENWKYLFVNYFKLEDIYNYFNKKPVLRSFSRITAFTMTWWISLTM